MNLTTNEIENLIQRRLRVLQMATSGGYEWIAKLSARMLYRYGRELQRRSNQERPKHEPILS